MTLFDGMEVRPTEIKSELIVAVSGNIQLSDGDISAQDFPSFHTRYQPTDNFGIIDPGENCSTDSSRANAN